MLTTGSDILAKALKRQGVEVVFFLLGGPLNDAENSCLAEGMRMIDVRHEQAAAMMAHAYSRVLNRPGVCMTCSGPGTTNVVTGVANAFVDCAPLVAIGGSSPVCGVGAGLRYFQEIDQLAMMKPIVCWADRVYETVRIPELVDAAFRNAFAAAPGTVYLDLPADVLYGSVEESEVRWVERSGVRLRPQGEPELIDQALSLLARAERPIVLSGSGVLWSDAARELQALVERAGVPFYAKPHARGVIPEDHHLSFPSARSTAFREADLILLVGSQLNYVIDYGRPPRFSPEAKMIQVDIDPAEIGRTRSVDVGIVGDAGSVLRQLVEAADARVGPPQYAAWVSYLSEIDSRKGAEREKAMSTDQVPIHPLRLCKEVRDFLDRDAILVVDGQEILSYGRQSIPTYVPRHRLNSGPFGTMGVGLPFGVGAKVAKPDAQVVVLHGDGSFGLNLMELDTAVRHNVPVLTVISNNGGWTATGGYATTAGFNVGRDLGFARYDVMAEALGCHGEYVQNPQEIRPALERAAASGKPAVVNVITEPSARAVTADFGLMPTEPTSS